MVIIITKCDKETSKGAGDNWESRLAHGLIDDGNSQGAEKGGQSAKSNVWDIVGDVVFSDVFKEEMSVVADQISHRAEHHFCQWRVNIEEILPSKIIRGKLSEVHLIKPKKQMKSGIEPKATL